jgi:hypothetical protein
MDKLNIDVILCLIASLCWFVGGVFSIFIYPTVLTVIGSLFLSGLFLIRALQMVKK